MEDERKFAKHKHDDVSKIELQIISFQLYNKQPFELKDVKKNQSSKNEYIDRQRLS